MSPFYIYPLKAPENQRFSGVFREYKMETLARYGFKIISRQLVFSPPIRFLKTVILFEIIEFIWNALVKL